MDRPTDPSDPTFAGRVLTAVAEVQSRWIEGGTPIDVFDRLLHHVLDITDSEYGFVAEVLHDEYDQPYMLARSMTDISWDEASRELVRQAHEGGGFAFRKLDSLYGTVLTTGKPVIANDAPNDPRASGVMPGHLALDRFLGLPLWSGDELVGAVGVANRVGGYDEALLEAIEPLTVTCGTLLRAYRERQAFEVTNRQLHDLAQTLRESLLPPTLPSIGWLDLAARFRPAQDGAGVLGDFYDVFQTVPGRWYFVIGDVRGHGPEAAKTTALARWTLQAHAGTATDPADLLDQLNAHLLTRKEPNPPHLSAISVVVDLEENESLDPLIVRLATAGHPPPIIRRADGTVVRLEPRGTVLGLFEDCQLETRTVELRPGDALLLFTDGVTEAGHQDLLYGELDLAEILSRGDYTSADEIADACLAMAEGPADRQGRRRVASDDTAVVVLRVPA